MQWWERREIWLGVLALILLVIFYQQVQGWLVGSLPPDLTAAGEGQQGGGAVSDAVQEVRLSDLSLAPVAYDPSGRNLFQYGQPPAPPKPPTPVVDPLAELRRRQEEEAKRKRVEEILRRKREQEKKTQEQRQALQPTPRPAARPAGPTPPAVNYKFVGYLGRPERKIAVLQHDGEVILKHEGERLGDDFVVREIRFDMVELGYTDPRFKDQKKLIPMGN
ncbi:MAG: hypothetical protein V3U98_10720 [Acidobacteriota bacterium]